MGQLILQLLIGAALITLATGVQTVGIALAMKARPHLGRRLRLRFRTMVLVISLGSLWMFGWQMAGMWIWALALLWLGAFPGLEPALYFTIAAYTTLGFGDVLPPDKWRLLGSMIGANGMLGFGMATAALVEFVQRFRAIRPRDER